MFDDPSQEELMAQAQAGDDQAFHELYRIHHTKLCTYLARLVGHNDQWRDLVDPFSKRWGPALQVPRRTQNEHSQYPTTVGQGGRGN